MAQSAGEFWPTPRPSTYGFVRLSRRNRSGLEVSKIVCPFVVVLTQDCDLEQDSRYRNGNKPPSTHDKKLFSILVAPLYNAEHVFQGTHLSDLQLTMSPITKKRTPGEMLMQNERPRYHYLDFQANIPMVPMIVDFKHYFSVSIAYIQKVRPKSFVCRLSELYREDLSQRFAAYLAHQDVTERMTAPQVNGLFPNIKVGLVLRAPKGEPLPRPVIAA